jgi:RND family efflux transporter MFP subunit
LVLCDLEGRSHEQAARHLGWPVGTVKSRQARGRQRLRDRLARRGLAPEAGLLAGALRPDGSLVLLSLALVDSTTVAAARWLTARAVVRGSAAILAQKVLRAMTITRLGKIASILLVAGATASGVNLLAQKGTSGAPPRPDDPAPAARAADAPSFEVKPGPLLVTVIGPGSLESARNQDVYCQVEGTTTIIKIVPEGTQVKKGEAVCELDSAALRDQLINQRITTKSAEANFQNAKLTREVAQIAVTEYVEGIYPQEQDRAKRTIATAQSAIQKAESRLERTRRARQELKDELAARKGARTSADIMAALDLDDRIEAVEQAIEVERGALELARTRQRVLEDYTKGKTIKELQSEVETAHSDELAKQATWELQKSKEEKLEKQIANCTLFAPIDGLVVYANAPSVIGGRPTIEEGVSVRERQKILSIPDLRRLQVNAKVGEAWIDKVMVNQTVKIRVHAFADQVLNGRVLEVSPLPDVTNLFTYPQKVYTTRVAVANRLPGLRPGMTADVEILVDQKDNVLSVPVEDVVRYDGKDHLAVQKPGGGFDWRDVVLGVSNDKYVEVKEGIRSGERVVLNPAALMSEEEKRAKLGAPAPPAAQPLLEEPDVPDRPAAKTKSKGARRPANPILEKLQNIPPEDRARMRSASLEQRIEILKKAGFTDEEIRQLGGMGGDPARPRGGRSRGSEP